MVYPFGSFVNGLGFRGSDLDLFVGLFPPDPIYSKLSARDKVELAANMLGRVPGVEKLRKILHARVPIVKFEDATGIHCDINFRDRLGVCNSEFIRLCIEADGRIRPLMMTIRYFAKIHGITAEGSGVRLSSYALTMLIIFYLQQIDPPLLHPVHTYQTVPGVTPDMISGWNCGFTRRPKKLPSLPTNGASLLDLLQGFFNFFNNSDFKSSVICPLLGLAPLRSLFNDPETIPPPLNKHPGRVWFDLNLTGSAMCVQDPFELTHNVAKNVSQRSLKFMKVCFEEAAKLLELMRHPEQRPPGGILAIFEMEVKIPQEKSTRKTEESEANMAGKGEKVITTERKGIKLSFSFPCAKLMDNDRENNGDVDPSKTRVLEIVGKVFKDCLKFEKIKNNYDGYDEWVVVHPVWKRRDSITKKEMTGILNKSLIELESEISEMVIEWWQKEDNSGNKNPFAIIKSSFWTEADNQIRLDLEVDRDSKKKLFPIEWFREYIENIVTKIINGKIFLESSWIKEDRQDEKTNLSVKHDESKNYDYEVKEE